MATAITVSGTGLAGVTPAVAQPAASNDLLTIGEIKSENGKLRAVLRVTNANRRMPADGGMEERTVMLRYVEGRKADDTPEGTLVWPPPPSGSGFPSPLPAPTLRARVGDRVEITLLNHVDVEAFPKGALDNAEKGEAGGCQQVPKASGGEIYPAEAKDVAPNCFHASSTTNLHFHGTHVTPDGLGDNVLLQLRPEMRVTRKLVKPEFDRIFAAGPPFNFRQLPDSWKRRQLQLLKQYDDNAVWQGKRGTPGRPALPAANRLLPPTEAAIARGDWPTYQIGAYPYCFDLTDYERATGATPRFEMGQCPGTHWYHAHKHGSTAINVFNGMAGVFIIEGKYDDDLLKIYPDLKKTEKVLIVQNFTDMPNLMRGTFDQQSLWVNGKLKPTITMRPGEIQLWRLVNASVRAVTTLTAFGAESEAKPQIRQIAQDGVQFKYENYWDEALLRPAREATPRTNTFAPGNRIDLLVRAPLADGTFEFKLCDTTNDTDPSILSLKVEGMPVSPAQEFPTEANFPTFPSFLADIDTGNIRIHRKLDFGWEAGRESEGLNNGAPKFMIDGKQFKGGHYDQTMVLGDSEEWTLLNTTTKIAHPFHLHINPFQVVEIYDPAFPGKIYKPEKNFVWQDVIAIPPSVLRDGKLDVGYVKVRHRFVDFPGSYVLHCHMLAHEDRGMMQLIRVIRGDVSMPHH